MLPSREPNACRNDISFGLDYLFRSAQLYRIHSGKRFAGSIMHVYLMALIIDGGAPILGQRQSSTWPLKNGHHCFSVPRLQSLWTTCVYATYLYDV